MFSVRKKESGFSLLELLVVMFIISLLSAIVLINYRGNQDKYALNQATQKVASDLRRAQNMAISGVDITGNYYGYGVYIVDDSTSYFIYGDVNGDSFYGAGDTTIETINLNNQIRIGQTAPLATKVDVFFRSPNPITYIDGSSLVGKTATVTLEIIGSALNKSVIITTSGLIEVD